MYNIDRKKGKENRKMKMGEKVRITKGLFEGLEGRIVDIDGNGRKVDIPQGGKIWIHIYQLEVVE